MTKIHSHGKTPEPHRKGLTRDELSSALVAKAVGLEVITKRLPRTGRSLRGRVTRAPHNKSAGKADHEAEKRVFANKSYMTRIATQLKR